MAKPKKKRRLKKPRSAVVLGMILTRKGGFMRDRREPRGGARNEQRDLLDQARDEG